MHISLFYPLTNHGQIHITLSSQQQLVTDCSCCKLNVSSQCTCSLSTLDGQSSSSGMMLIGLSIWSPIIYFLFCFVLFCFVLFCFVLFCFVLFCFVLFCFVCCSPGFIEKYHRKTKPRWTIGWKLIRNIGEWSIFILIGSVVAIQEPKNLPLCNPILRLVLYLETCFTLRSWLLKRENMGEWAVIVRVLG
jgi:hypothetical protein